MQSQLKLGRLLWDAARTYVGRLPIFLAIVLVPSVAAAAIFVAVSRQILGFSAEGAGMDPTTLGITLSREQWVLITGGGIATAIVVSLAMAATIHAAGERLGLRQVIGKITAKSMQIFWLQVVIYALAARFSPFTVPILWFPLAFGVGVAIREDLGPSDAMERAWVLSEGSRARLLVLEVLLLVPLLACAAGIAYLFLIPGPWINLNAVAPQNRQYFSAPIMALFLIPIQFMFVALTRGYEMLKQAEPEAGLHAQAASNVSSS